MPENFIDGGLSGGSSMRKPGSEEPNQGDENVYIISKSDFEPGRGAICFGSIVYCGGK